ncbi:T9SS type A sorting domain-containing protein [Myroides ceti]|uniref:T9SS type A sorting domain-containing protein n=1 Tax=Paenimyroides ceti TaxID=395087 RepID=A0ABT8D1Z4_9FLAO|nr:T9SS type A sorting domain-containing protein [Paenimyroides ceti]MDN3705772.1 T9SS type A sorting domain-containing protein [Paenimyroides ceti]MDN3709239.1 T9SS type A sorting domain-containing protein [Paenimyroides ceti]
MKKIYLLLLLLLMSFWRMDAQVGYGFSHEIGLFQENSASATTLTSVHADSAISDAVSLGFTFNYEGVNYTQFKMSSNGFISFNMGASTLTTNSFVEANLTSRPIIAPLWDDLDGRATGGSRASYELTGTVPNRVMTIEWKNWEWFYDSTNPVISFQIKLYETTNVIEFIYRQESGNVTSSASASIGIGGATVANGYLNVTSVTAPAVSSTSHVTNISAKPANNQVFRFTPPPPCNGMPVGGTVNVQSQMICPGSTPAIINVTGYTPVATASNITYQWEESDDNGVADEWANAVGGSGATTTSYTPPAFGGNTKYYRLKVTCTATNQSAYSDVSVVNNMTLPATAAHTITFTEVTPTTMKINWTNGNGNRRYVVINTTNTFTDPVSGTGPAISGVNTSYSGAGQQIVYDGTGSAVTVTNLVCNTTYYVRVYEYNRCGTTAPFTYYYNITNSTTNPASQLSNYPVVSMPQSVNFTGFTGSNLTTVFPNWREGSGADKPVGTTSLWAESTILGVPTAKINLYNNNRKEWIVSNKITVNAASRINFKAAITKYNLGTAHEDGMQGTDDKVQVMISVDGCGDNWSPLFTFNAANTSSLVNVLTDYTVNIPVQYIGQDVMVAFFASDGPVDDLPDYDFHITNIVVENIPNCELPTNVVISGVTKNSAVITWEASSSSSLLGYTYEVRTTGAPGSGAQGLASSGTLNDILTYTATGLLPATTYNVYIRTQCQTTVFSEWTIMKTFTTLCDYPDVLTTTPGTLCGIGTTVLSATTDATGTLRWYTSPTSRFPVFTGASFQTPEISETTSYYVAASAGTVNDNIYLGTATTASSDLGYSPFTYGWGGYKYQYTYKAEELIAAGLTAGPITSLALDVLTAGANRNDFTIYLGHTTQTAATTTHVSGTTLVYSNANQPVTAGSNQYIFATPFQWDGVSNVVVQFCWSNNNSGVSGQSTQIRYHVTPFNSLTATYADNKTAAQILATMSGSVDSSGNTATYANRANMVFNSTCISPRVEVLATVNPAPSLELSTAVLEICEGSDSTAVTIITGASEYDVYTWEPSTGISGDAQNGWIFNPSVSTVYTLTASQSTGTMCRIIKELQINVKELPEFQSLPEEINVCVGEIQELDGGVVLGEQELLNETFSNGTTLPANWQTQGGGVSVVNANTAGGTANELKITGSSFSNVIRRAYYGPIDTSGLQELTLQWRNFLNHYSGNYNYSVKVQTSSDGTTWNNTSWVTNPVTATQAAGIVSTVINTADVGSSTFYVSFTVEGVDFGMHNWNIDDVLLTADQEYQLEWSPSDNLYEDAEATVPYSGTIPLAKVYYKANTVEVPTQYTLTITNPANCSVENTVEITTLEKPVIDPVTNPISFCDATNVEDITINTNNEDNIIKWYASLASTTELTQISQSGTYYVEAVGIACNSERVAVQITIVDAQLPTVIETQYFCDAGTVADLSATVGTGFTIRWYDAVASTTPLSETTDLVNGVVYYAATYHADSGCESPRIPVTAVITPTPSAIPAQAISLCQSTQFGGLQLSAMPNATLKWYVSMTATQPISSSLIVTTGTYYVSQIINSCESVRSQIQIAVYAGLERPAANTHNICGSGTVADLTATGAVAGAVYNWYNSATSTTPLALTAALTSGVYYVSQSIEGCESPRRSVTVKIINQTAPVVNAFVLCGSGTVADLYLPTATYVTYRWYATATSTVELAQNVALTTGTYYVARVEHGCVSQRTAVTVTIADLPSSPTGETSQNFTVNTIGEATIADLVMDQTNIVWYITEADAKNGNNALPAEAPLVSGQTYYAVIIGTNGCPSLPTAVTVVITLGMDDFDKTNLVFYPNPTSDILNIRYKNNIDQLVVYNLLGQKVMMQRFDNNEIQLDMSALASGNYLIELHSDNQIQIIKVVRK